MTNKSTFNQFMLFVADYIDSEYGGNNSSELRNLTFDEKHTIKNILDVHYNNNDSVNNTANDIMNYLKQDKIWTKKNDR